LFLRVSGEKVKKKMLDIMLEFGETYLLLGGRRNFVEKLL